MSTISAELQLKTSQFHAAFGRVDAELVSMRNRVDGLGSAFKGFAWIGGAALAGIAAAAVQLKSAFDLGGKLADLSANTGMAASDVLILRQAFVNAGLGADDLQGNIARLHKALTGTNEEGEATNAALQRLGLAAGQLDAMTAVQQIQRLQQAFATIEDPAMRTRTAMELFGKSGARMLALLGDSSALQLATEQVGSLGAIMDANAGKFDRMSDSINTLSGLKLEQLFAGIAAEAAGSADNMERITKLDFSSVGSGVFKAISSSLNPAYGFLKAVSTLRSKFLASRATPVANLVSANAETEDNFNQRMADPGDRAALLNDITRAADEARAKLAAVDKEWLGYGPKRIDAVKGELTGHINVLDAQAAALRAVGAAAEQSGAQQASAAQMSAEAFARLVEKQKVWARDREQLLGEAGRFWQDEEMAAAESPEARRKILTGRVGMDSVAAMDAEIARLHRSIATGINSNTGNEIASLKELMDTRRAVAAMDREEAGKAKEGRLAEIDKNVAEQRSKADDLLDLGRLPHLQAWADATRVIGLGGNASTNADAIARVQAERQREANATLRRIEDLLKRREKVAEGEMVFG